MHRDVKPENILIESLRDMRIKLADFSFATFNYDGKILGSPAFMAPEVILGQEYDTKVDVWSVGVIVYYMLSGRLPFQGQDVHKTFKAILSSQSLEGNFSLAF